MKIVFLSSALPDLRWFKLYYTRSFPAGRDNANRQFQTLLELLRNNPHIGRAYEGERGVRRYPVPRTPFTILYRARPEQIEILRVYDQRSNFSNKNG